MSSGSAILWLRKEGTQHYICIWAHGSVIQTNNMRGRVKYCLAGCDRIVCSQAMMILMVFILSPCTRLSIKSTNFVTKLLCL